MRWCTHQHSVRSLAPGEPQSTGPQSWGAPQSAGVCASCCSQCVCVLAQWILMTILRPSSQATNWRTERLRSLFSITQPVSTGFKYRSACLWGLHFNQHASSRSTRASSCRKRTTLQVPFIFMAQVWVMHSRAHRWYSLHPGLNTYWRQH